MRRRIATFHNPIHKSEGLPSAAPLLSVLSFDAYVIKAAYVDISTIAAPSGAAGNYGYVVSAPYSIKDGTNTYKTYDMWNGSAKVTVIDKGTAVVPVKGSIVTYTDKGNGYIESTSITAISGAITGFSDKTLAISSTAGAVSSFNRVDKTVYMYIDSKNVAGVSSGEIALSDTATTGARYQNVYYILATGSDLALVVYEVNNQFENATSTYLYAANGCGAAVTAPVIGGATASGITIASITADKTFVVGGDKVAYTVTYSGTATAGVTMTITPGANTTIATATLAIANTTVVAAGTTTTFTALADGVGAVTAASVAVA